MRSSIAAAMMMAAGALFVSAGTASAASLVSAKKLEINVDETKTEEERKALWEKVGGWCAIAEWHPAVDKCEESKEGDDTFRTLTLKDGGKIEESVTKYDAAGKSISYKIDNVDVKVLPVNNYAATITVKDAGGKSEVEWKGAFYRGFMNNDPPPELTDEAAVKAVTAVYTSGLQALKAKAEGK